MPSHAVCETPEAHLVPIISTFTGLFLRPFLSANGKMDREAIAKGLRKQFNPEHRFLVRDDRHAIHVERSKVGTSEPVRIGQSRHHGADQKGVDYREYVFSEEVGIGHCSWQHVRWRFYRNGRIAFHAGMRNDSKGLDTGDMQGHRIELRADDGQLIGAWTAEFFVRRQTAVREFPAHMLDEHPLLLLHFDELADHQTGCWFHER